MKQPKKPKVPTKTPQKVEPLIPPAIDRNWAGWLESAEAQGCLKSKTPAQQKQIRNLLEVAFRAGWRIGDNQPTCFTCSGKPVRGGNRQGSALCQRCYDDDTVY